MPSSFDYVQLLGPTPTPPSALPKNPTPTKPAGQLIFVPSYFDYVWLRSFLDAQDAPWDGCCEYTPGDEAARQRAGFRKGKPRVLVYTERAHFYHRHALHGVKVRAFARAFACALRVRSVQYMHVWGGGACGGTRAAACCRSCVAQSSASRRR